MKAHRGSRGIALRSLQITTLDGVVCSTPHPDRFTPPERDPVLMVQEAVWNSGLVWKGAGKLAATWIRSPNRPAPSESQYRLRYAFYKRVLRPGLPSKIAVFWDVTSCSLLYAENF